MSDFYTIIIGLIAALNLYNLISFWEFETPTGNALSGFSALFMSAFFVMRLV